MRFLLDRQRARFSNGHYHLLPAFSFVPFSFRKLSHVQVMRYVPATLGHLQHKEQNARRRASIAIDVDQAGNSDEAVNRLNSREINALVKWMRTCLGS
jgi:hypothetical protein